MGEYIGYKIARDLRSVTLSHYDKKTHERKMISIRTPHPCLVPAERKRVIAEFLTEYGIPVPERIK